jgi:ribosomal protein S12 methylthiotransferase accessory factor
MAQLLGVGPWPTAPPAVLDLGESAEAAAAVAGALGTAFTSVDRTSLLARADSQPHPPSLGVVPGAQVVVLTDDFDDPALGVAAGILRANRCVWFAATLTSAQLWFGPVIAAEGRPCWRCFQTRLRLHQPLREYLAAHGAADRRPPNALPVTLAAGAGLLAVHIASMGSPSRPTDAAFTFDFRTGISAWHHVPALPQCPACGDGIGTPWLGEPPREADGSEFEPTSDRRWTAAMAKRQLGAVVSPVTGAVARLTVRRSPPMDPVAVAVADYSFTSHIPSLAYLERHVPKRAAGKGWDLLSAEVGALGEALERHSSVFRGDETRTRASFRQMADEHGAAVHPEAVLLFSDGQYRDRDRWNARLGRERDARHRVPRRLASDEVIDWSPVWDLKAGRKRWLPSGLAFINHREPHWQADARLLSDPPFFGDSNGTGAGATLGEAVWRGLAEAIERDAVGIWWYNRLLLPRIEVRDLGVSRLWDVHDHLRRQGRDFWCVELTHDLGLPVVAAVSARSSDGGGVGFGFAAAPSRADAAEQATQELLQILRRYDSFERSTEEHGTLPERFYREVTVATDPYLCGESGAGYQWNDADLADRVPPDLVMRLLDDAGLSILVADVSRPDVPLRVAKVIIPGLRHMWARLAPGRLTDVPVAMGWSDSPTAEHLLNPWPVWL